MISGVVTHFLITLYFFTCDLFKIIWLNNDFVFKGSIPREKKNGYGPIKNLGDRSKVVLALLFYLLLFPNGLQELEY